MSNYTFICEEESTPYSTAISWKRTVEFRADSLNDVLEQFESFLRGSGFVFKGVLDIVDNEFEDTEPDWIVPREKKDFDFSEIPQNNWPFANVDNEQKSSLNEEHCLICKIPKSVMKSQKCYDANCPKTSWLLDLDYKLASEK